MIETFEGRLGGGKSYTAVQRIIRVLCAGGYVATNIKLMVDPWGHPHYGSQRGLREICRLRGWDLKSDQIIELKDCEYIDYRSRHDQKPYRLSQIQGFWTLVPRISDGVILVVIDEAHFHFPQSGYRSIPNDVVEFLTLSRHCKTDVIFISQHIKNMWCQMSRLAQYRWEFRDMKKRGIYIKFNLLIPAFTLPWPFPHILQSQYDYDGKTLISKVWDWHDKTIHECYTSPDLINAFSSAGQRETYKLKKGLTMGQKLGLAGVGFLTACLIWGVVYWQFPRERVFEVVKTVTNTVSVVSSLPAVESKDPSLPEVEYYTCSLVGSGRSDVLYTTKGSYRAGDLLPDGKIITRIVEGGFVVASSSGLETIHFSPAPKQLADKSDSTSPFNFN